MNEDTRPRPWRVWARLTGPFLPEEDLWIGNAIVGPGPGGFRPPDGPSALTVTPQDDLSYYTATAPILHVESTCCVVVPNVIATNIDDAIRQVVQNDIPIVIAAFSAGLSKTPHRIEIWGADDGEEGSGFSPVVGVATFHKTALSPEQVSMATARAGAISHDKNLRIASEIFYRAIRYGDLAAGELTTASAILSFYQVLEACANVVAWERPYDYESKAKDVIAMLQRGLGAKALTSKRVAAIKTAHDALNRLDAAYTGLRIENAARAFGLDNDWIIRAKDLAKFRNVKLGHANVHPSAREMSEWVADDGPKMTAFAVASQMLAAALSYSTE